MYCLLTFPRSGSIFFIKSVNIDNIYRTHKTTDIKDQDVVLGILRNPVESISSWLSMGYYRSNFRRMFDGPDPTGKLPTPEQKALQGKPLTLNDWYYLADEEIKKAIAWYAEVYDYYANNECYLVLNESLRGDPAKTINNLFETFGTSNAFFELENKDLTDPDQWYLDSSKELVEYDAIRNFVMTHDLSALQELYEKSAAKALF
jgi:hypothetical protein